ncbi:MAG: geranylgeranylglyceryl phosphate synthase family protein [Flavobacteriales bacterium]|nr:geranylgeranylglyceryl phosphate synthase family protein [Flavobacteriales bacterium]
MSLVYPEILQARNGTQKLLYVLIDPDKWTHAYLKELFSPAYCTRFDAVLVGGSELVSGDSESCVRAVRSYTNKPVILFPGDPGQLTAQADSLFLLSLLSGRNPEYLIGHHVAAAQKIRSSDLEVIPTAYIVIGEHVHSSVLQTSGTLPIPSTEIELIQNTALSGEQLGFELVYLEYGSGANKTPNPDLIRAVRKIISVPLAVGGGVRSRKDVQQLWYAGADVVVVGTAIEQDLSEFFNS